MPKDSLEKLIRAAEDALRHMMRETSALRRFTEAIPRNKDLCGKKELPLHIEIPLNHMMENVEFWQEEFQSLLARANELPRRDREILTSRLRLVLEIIENHPQGIQGPEVLLEAARLAGDGAPKDSSELTGKLIPTLRDSGWAIENIRGKGYFIKPS